MNPSESYITTRDGLPFPQELIALITAGIWPTKSSQIRREDLVSSERVKSFAPEEWVIYLSSPPFCTIQNHLEWEFSRPEQYGNFWQKFGALNEIDPKLTVDIADFEIGSDSCVALDYRQDVNNPSVIRLKWFQSREIQKDGMFKVKSETHWVPVAPTFAAFAEMLGLHVP